MHVVVVFDTTQATQADRVRLWVNGEKLSSFSLNALPSQNYEGHINTVNPHYIGRDTTASRYFDGYLADVHFIDSQAHDPTSFAEFDANGIWQPIEYGGTYPGNSFHLPFSNNSTAAALGNDTSPNNNDWTVNNISVAAGADNDSLVDSPTNYGTDTGLGAEVRGNYATLNSLWGGTSLTNGNLQSTLNAARPASLATLRPSSGKWYFEVYITGTNPHVGLYDEAQFNTSANTSSYIRGSNGAKVGLSGGTFTFGQNDLVQCAVDFDGGTIQYAKNGGSYSSFTITNTNAPNCFMGFQYEGIVNFGQRSFAYSPPSGGYKALCTANLPTPTIADGRDYMDVALYTGTGTSQTISGLKFSPDLVWIKQRNTVRNHQLVDTVRGATLYLRSDHSGPELTTATGLTAFTSDGFSLGSDAGYNENAGTYVAWCWDAGSSTVTNTDGTITSSVRANPTAGFSIVTYTGNAVNGATFGHGLGVAPEMVIIKQRSDTRNWIVGHQYLDATVPWDYIINLDRTVGRQLSAGGFNSTAPTSSVVTVSNTLNNNGLGETYVAYCFAPVRNYSVIGKYVGNGSTDGPYVFTNFRPRYVLLKRAENTSNWPIRDTARDTYNVSSNELLANVTTAENLAGPEVDYLSNGFKVRTTGGTHNASGEPYIYYAVAESSLSIARAR
jgi:hypothetical protein